MRFHRGQRVVCVDASWHPDHEKLYERPVSGCVYVVRDVVADWTPTHAGLRLVGIRNPAVRWNDGTTCELAFRASRFRPVVTHSTETGMAILRGLLDASPVSLNEEVG